MEPQSQDLVPGAIEVRVAATLGQFMVQHASSRLLVVPGGRLVPIAAYLLIILQARAAAEF